MGLFDYFRRRRERESAIGSLEVTVEPSRELPSRAPSPESGLSPPAAVDPGSEAGGLGRLAWLGTMIAKAAREGSIQVHHGEPGTLDLDGSGLRREISEIMRRHGVEPQAGGVPDQVEPRAMAEMQREILDAIGRRSAELGGALGGHDPGHGPPAGR